MQLRQNVVTSQKFDELEFMEITGKIIAALPEKGGVSARTGNAWKAQEFVVETQNEQYPRRCVFSVFGEDKLNEMRIQVGDVLTVYFDIDAREYQGRWFNDVRAWKVTRVADPAMGQPAPQPFTPPTPDSFSVASPSDGINDGGSADDLPF